MHRYFAYLSLECSTERHDGFSSRLSIHPLFDLGKPIETEIHVIIAIMSPLIFAKKLLMITLFLTAKIKHNVMSSVVHVLCGIRNRLLTICLPFWRNLSRSY